MKKPFILLALLSVSLMLYTPVARAACDSQFNQLHVAIDTATFVGPKALQDREGLHTKATNAETKANKGKTADAITKLNEIKTKVDLLVSQGKISAGGDAINDAADTTIGCL